MEADKGRGPWLGEVHDGLLYHKVVADGVNDAVERKRKQSKRGAKGAAARWGKQDEPMLEASRENATSII